MSKKEWQKYGARLRDLLELEYSSVAVSCRKKPALELSEKKLRICRAILQAGKGETVQLSKENNACFGAAWHLGFQRIKDPKVAGMIEKFVVEGEKLFSSYDVLHNIVTQMGDVPDNSKTHFVLAPLEKAEHEPALVIFICDALAACRILTLATFVDGTMPQIKIGGPTCRMAIIYPIVAGEVNISFYDYTARKMCNVEKDKLLVSIPYSKIPNIIESIDKCSAGTAKVEYPQEFREFLHRSLAPKRQKAD